jgi:hypothetical protein
MSVEDLTVRVVPISEREEQVATEMSVRKEVEEVLVEVLTAEAEVLTEEEARAVDQVVVLIAQVAVEAAVQVEVHQGRNSIE